MEARELRGLEIATNSEITREGNIYIVPSQSSSKKYSVNLFINTCTCLDYESNRHKCKHIYAAQCFLERESGLPLPAPETSKKPTYKQEWHAYNLAQTNEKAKFQELLYDLCQNIEEPVQAFGRPRALIADLIFAACVKVYGGMSGRRNSTDVREALSKGRLSKPVHYNTLSKYLEKEELTPYLKELISQSSLPLKAVEQDFAADSSGFSTCRYVRWLHAKYGKAQIIDKQDWIKMHLMCGVKTNIVTAVEMSGRYAGDSPRFKPLVETTARNFTMRQVSADKAYLSGKNLRLVVKNSAMPYIPFKSNSTPAPQVPNTLWTRMYHFYEYNKERFMENYHKRSNVESTFSMIKAKFGESLRSKTERAQINEALCKVLCHNICVVIQSMYELGIEPVFWAGDM